MVMAPYRKSGKKPERERHGGILTPKPPKGVYPFREKPDPQGFLKREITRIPEKSFIESLYALHSHYARYLWRRLPIEYQNKEFMRLFTSVERQRFGILTQLAKNLEHERIDPNVAERNFGTVFRMVVETKRLAEKAGNKKLVALCKSDEINFRRTAEVYNALRLRKAVSEAERLMEEVRTAEELAGIEVRGVGEEEIKAVILEINERTLRITSRYLYAKSHALLGEFAERYFVELSLFDHLALHKLTKSFPL